MDIGNKEIPLYRLSSTMLGDLKTIYEKFGRDEKSLEVIAEALGHKSAKSGTFLMKIASMRSYGIVAGRGSIAVTDMGEKITRRRNDREYNEALLQAILKIPLWSMLYDKFLKQGKSVSSENLILELPDLCGLKIEEAKKLAPDVARAFEEDTKSINLSVLQDNNVATQLDDQHRGSNSQKSQSHTPPKHDNLEPIGYGEYQVYLPKEPEEQKQVWRRLKAMVDAYISPDNKQ